MTPPNPLITGTDFITIAMKDFERAIGFFEDPDGNALAIHHRAPGVPPAAG